MIENKIIPKIKELLNPQNNQLVQFDKQKLQNVIKNIAEEVRIFLKEQQATLSKDLAKKTKQLFVLSSDNESLKQKIEDLQNKLKRSNEKISEKEKQIVKLMNDKQRQKRELQQKLNETISELRKQVSNLELKYFQAQTKHKGQVSDLRKIHKEQISKAIYHEQQIAQNNIQKLRHDFSQQKKNLIQTQNKQKSELIKKYQHKLQELRDNHDRELFQLTKNHNQIKEKDSKIKTDLNNKLFTFENTIKRLQGELSKQTLGHQKLKAFSASLSNQLQEFQKNHTREINDLNEKLQKSKEQQSKNEKQMKDEINKLKETLRVTIIQKDMLFQQTVNTMKNQHRDQLQSIKVTMMQEKQIEITQSQMKHYAETQKMNKQYFNLQRQFNDINLAYQTVQKQYQVKIENIIQEYQLKLTTIQKRNDYQLSLEGQSAKKTFDSIERKYKLQIKSLNKQFQETKQELTKKINDQKLSTTNKLTTQYQTIINDIKINNQVNMKQKVIEFDRKSKAYQKKLTQAQKRRVDLKIQMDRQKLQMQMKIDSLGDLTQKLQSEIEELHQHIIKLQKQKTTVMNQFQFKLLMKKNQFQQFKDQFEVKEHELRTIFNEQLRIKNSQIQRFSQKISLQVQNMILKQNKRVQLIEKQYCELKKIMNERTSLPQDIEALKIFHQGYIKLQQEIEKQRQMKKSVQRQLQSKCAIQKVFTSKAFVPRAEDPNPIKIVTMRQFYKPTQKSIKSRIQNNI